MSEYLLWFIPILALLLIPIIIFLWNNISMLWLNISATLIVISLPFERIPSLDISGFTIRFSQVFTVISIGFAVLLWLKGELINYNWSKLNYWIFALFVSMLPSLFFVENWSRFIATFTATTIVFFAALIIANFLKFRLQTIVGLFISMISVGAFAFYQFFGDLLGLPISLTFLRETYTKKVFGFPRIHSTALEPLYFAGMLFFPIFVSLILFLQPNLGSNVIESVQLKTKFWGSRFNKFILNKKVFKYFLKGNNYINLKSIVEAKICSLEPNKLFLALLIFFSTLFVLTIAKGAWLAIVITLFGLVITTWNKLNWKMLFTNIILLLCIVSPILFIAYLTFPQVQNSADKVFQNFAETATGISSTSTERSNFQGLAVNLLDSSTIFGIGSGQYGIKADRPLRSMKADKNQYFIVNNVYLEIWLEEGLFFLIIFCGMWVLLLLQGIAELSKKAFLSVENSVHLAIILAVISSLIQWQTFSPIYIMPIFILLGLLANFNQNHE